MGFSGIIIVAGAGAGGFLSLDKKGVIAGFRRIDRNKKTKPRKKYRKPAFRILHLIKFARFYFLLLSMFTKRKM